jgi:hypothetical protein
MCTTVCSSSCQYPATSHSHLRGVEQHSTGHIQQPDQLYAKEMCRAAWSKWWSHQTLTGFLIPHAPTFFKRYLWPTDAYMYSQSCEIHRLVPNEFISIDWFPHMNCNSVRSSKLSHVAFIFLFRVDCVIPLSIWYFVYVAYLVPLFCSVHIHLFAFTVVSVFCYSVFFSPFMNN